LPIYFSFQLPNLQVILSSIRINSSHGLSIMGSIKRVFSSSTKINPAASRIVSFKRIRLKNRIPSLLQYRLIGVRVPKITVLIHLKEFAMIKIRNAWLGLWAMTMSGLALAADLDRSEVEQRLAKAEKDHPADLRRKDLTDLDLSGLDFRNADLWGSDLRRSNLSNSNLSGLNLDLTVMTKINLSGANLANTSIFGVSMIGANLSNANLTGSRFIANLDRSNLSHANLSDAHWGVDMKNQPMGLMRVSLNNVNLAGANLSNADLNRALMRHANLSGSLMKNANLFGADLSGANLADADLSGADLSETKLEDANFSGANLAGARFSGIKDKSSIKGLSEAKNVESAIFD
jgi:uncharacterized protein YjbI with pentapeptide repeats